ncbi:competence type IV pilus minor pilin ComGG [Cytobacillus dafuensis]|uniref:Competence protein ComG n=1 Tax=Cytobacillus dafuensis TaxID=1742359 RepID=A0A5B8Z6H2_CYTDA|nr:competence type IV pilus minor pilin ComGG [Cytobacillus dafuensis]QED48614.1 hypothetical protein FSZ17_15930 [Cytobacillus dafuensis]
MLQNERGFTYPLTFCFILLAALVLSVQIDSYLSEVRFLKESEAILKQEYYLLSSMKRVENILIEGDEELFSGFFTFTDGTIRYETSQLTATLYMVTFNLKIGSYPDIKGFGYFDEESGKMIKWVERN